MSQKDYILFSIIKNAQTILSSGLHTNKWQAVFDPQAIVLSNSWASELTQGHCVC